MFGLWAGSSVDPNYVGQMLGLSEKAINRLIAIHKVANEGNMPFSDIDAINFLVEQATEPDFESEHLIGYDLLHSLSQYLYVASLPQKNNIAVQSSRRKHFSIERHQQLLEQLLYKDLKDIGFFVKKYIKRRNERCKTQ